jgi:hypothetical protein
MLSQNDFPRLTNENHRSEDIEHDQPEDVAGGLYGELVQFMRRQTADAP